MYTPEQVKSMPMDELLELVEQKLGRQVDAGTRLFFAMCHGGTSVMNIDLSDPSKSGDQSIDYEEMARLLNGPDGEWMEPYQGARIEIRDPEHFAQAFLFAVEHTDVTESWDRHTPLGSLVECFHSLSQIAKNYEKTGYHYIVYRESFAGPRPSFYYECLDGEDKRVGNGGIICHQNGDDIHWSNHT